MVIVREIRVRALHAPWNLFVEKTYFFKNRWHNFEGKLHFVNFKVHFRSRDSQAVSRYSQPLDWNSYSTHQNKMYTYKKHHCSKTWLSHFRRARQFVFDDTLGLYQTAVNFYQYTFSTSRGLLCNSLGTPDLFKLSAIWIWRGPWNRKFSAPSSPSSKSENCVHPPKIGLNLGFVWRKVFLRKGVRPAPVPFTLFLGI